MTTFLRQEVRALLRTRRAKIIAAVICYALLAFPIAMKQPPQSMVDLATTWFDGDGSFTLFMFAYLDLNMNKVAMFAGIILAGGIIADERARGELPLLWSKPVTRARYFLVRLTGAVLLFALIYATVTLIGTLYYPSQVAGFDPLIYLGMATVHLFAACYAVTLAGTMGVLLGRKIPAMLISLLLLGTFVGIAFLPFYTDSAWLGWLNPFYHGVSLIGQMHTFTLADMLTPIAALLAFHLATAALGAWKVSREEQ
ncbi:ABC transporter permease [Nonomuraea sp. NPDC050153]|uniref:ABC transporter permease n=1 Tax=Nonomuraea sp. NPDC050153 TaxID=3364359 RepID=UPI00378DDA75